MLGHIVAASPADADPFLGALASVASALLGFLGGFFVLRLQNYAQEWRELALEIERLSRIQEATMQALSGVLTDDAAGERLLERNEQAMRALAPLVHRRGHVKIPVELIVQLLVLLALTVLGVWRPLLMMSSPTQAAKVWLVGPVVVLVTLSWVAMVAIAQVTLRRLRATAS